jgi:dynein heavy chain
MRCLPPAQCKRLEGGLDKLKEATIQLDELNLKLAEQKIVLAEKSAACEALLEEIATNTAIGKGWGWAISPGASLCPRCC